MFVNTLVLRTQVRGQESFTDLLAQVRETDLQAFTHADIPFERLVDLLQPERSTARNPLFQVALSFQNVPGAEFELPGLRVGAVDFETDIERFDLSVIIRESTDDSAGLFAEFSFARDLFDDATVEVLARRFVRLLHRIADLPQAPLGDLELLTEAERADLLNRVGAPAVAGRTLPELLAAAARDPQAVAVVEGRSVPRTVRGGEVCPTPSWTSGRTGWRAC